MSDKPKPGSGPLLPWSDADERAMDALLKDCFRTHLLQSDLPPSDRPGLAAAGAGRLDFTDVILARLEKSKSLAKNRGNATVTPARSALYRHSFRWVAALAASILTLVVVRYALHDATLVALPAVNQGDKFSVADSHSSSSATQDGRAATTDPRFGNIAISDVNPSTDALAPQVSGGSIKQPRREPIVLSLDSSELGPGKEISDRPTVASSDIPSVLSDSPTSGSPMSDSLKENAAPSESIANAEVGRVDPGVASDSVRSRTNQPAKLTDFNRQFAHYWQAMGVSPAPAIDDLAWRDRISARFGFQPTVSEDRRGTRNALLLSAEQSRLLAERVVGQLATGLKHDVERTEQLVSTAALVIAEGGRFDRWLSDWVESEVVVGEPIAAATSHSAAIGQWVAGRILGADVRCARCHDSPIDSRYNQHDYWSVAAMFAPPQSPPLFYELVDGRQRVAAPGTSLRWLGLPQADKGSARLETRQELAVALVGNRQVARSLANHLWSIGFGTPLVSPASSPIAPPRDDSIQQALEMLSDRLIASDFDIRTALQWVIDCEPMKRGTPIELQNEAWQVADESKLAAASLAQRSFAAARSHWPSASPTQLLAMMESRSGRQPSKLEARDSVLAQPLTAPVSLEPLKASTGAQAGTQTGTRGVKSGNQAAVDQDYWWTQWLADREGLRGGWMESIVDRDQQIRHAFYASGHTEVTARQLQWVDSLFVAVGGEEASRNDTIAKIYWIIQNAR